MTYLILAVFVSVAVLTIIGSIRLKVWEQHGRIVNGNWITDDERLHLMSRWGAGY
ncbi:MAG TPA: hypothetical protein VKN62_06925 [Pelovirga sp.]|nr:hypothetical protein [Pelovirga sp.]